MALYIVDWGEGCNGARFMFVAAGSLHELWESVDMVGDPYMCRYRRWNGPLSIDFDLVDQRNDEVESTFGWVENLALSDSDAACAMSPHLERLLGKKGGWKEFTEKTHREVWASWSGEDANDLDLG